MARMARVRSTDDGIDGKDSVGLYLEEIARTPLLTAEEEVELAETVEAGLLAEQLLAEGGLDVRRAERPNMPRRRSWSGWPKRASARSSGS